MSLRMFRSYSRRPHANLPAEEEAQGSLRRTLLRSSSSETPLSTPKEHGSVLEKQKMSMRTWAKRYCWLKDGRMRWAETKNGTVGKERGGVFLSDIVKVEAVDDEKRRFSVTTEDRTINFAADTDDDMRHWIALLQPRTRETTRDDTSALVVVGQSDGGGGGGANTTNAEVRGGDGGGGGASSSGGGGGAADFFLTKVRKKRLRASSDDLDGDLELALNKDDDDDDEDDEDLDERLQILRRFNARLVKSEEVVVTVRSNLSVEISKFVGGGFRLRLDELRKASTVPLAAAEAKALVGFETSTTDFKNDVGPLCVVAEGDTPWSGADPGACLLALTDDDAKRQWRDVVAECARPTKPKGAHCRLAGWKLPEKWRHLFGSNPFEAATSQVDALERFLATTDLRITTSDDFRVRFPSRYALPATTLNDDRVVVNVAVLNTATSRLPEARLRGVRCLARATVTELAAEVARKIVDHSEERSSERSSDARDDDNDENDLDDEQYRLQATLEALLDDGADHDGPDHDDDDDADDDDDSRKKKDSSSSAAQKKKKTKKKKKKKAGPRWVFRVAGLRSYLVLRDAPLVASADVVEALRSSTSLNHMEVDLVLETGLGDREASALALAATKLTEWHGDLLKTTSTDEVCAAFPTDQTAAALRAKPPTVAKLEAMPDAMMEPYIPQLVQSLKAEDPPVGVGFGEREGNNRDDDDDDRDDADFEEDAADFKEDDGGDQKEDRDFPPEEPPPEEEEEGARIVGGPHDDDDDQEKNHEEQEPSALTKFLLVRALRNPTFVGSSFFWALRSEMSRGGRTATKHGAMLAAYVGAVGTRFRAELEKQVVLDAQLRWIAGSCATLEDKHARNAFATRELRRLSRSGELPAGMDLPCLPGKRAGRVRPDSCKVLSSKAAPLLLVFDDAEFGVDAFVDGKNTTTVTTKKSNGPPLGGGRGSSSSFSASSSSLSSSFSSRSHVVIFKTRDDLRQDAAMLQAMRQMDALWLRAGVECFLKTYRVNATDVDVGWIEVVRDAKETSEIQSVWGSGALGGAFQNHTLHDYLAEHNADAEAFKAARSRFAASCAACCVATYVLGIADRHNGNIMLHRSGSLFHIDFGHVLGNFKKIKAINVKRERTNLVLTPEMMFVINQGKHVQMNDDFVDRCKLLVEVLNKGKGNGSLLHTLLLQLVPANLPEINDTSIHWLPNVLLNNDIVNELTAALNDKFRRIDNSIHNRIHQGGSSSNNFAAGAGPRKLAGGGLGQSNNASRRDQRKNYCDDGRRVSTITEAHHEIEELRKLLSEAEKEKKVLAQQLAALSQGDGRSAA